METPNLAQRFAEWFANKVIGTAPYVLLGFSGSLLWMAVNHWVPFDPYPYILLNLMLSEQATITGPLILMSQNMQKARDDKKDDEFRAYQMHNMQASMAQMDLQKAHNEWSRGEIEFLHKKVDAVMAFFGITLH